MAYALTNFIFSQTSAFSGLSFKHVAGSVSASKKQTKPKMAPAFKESARANLKARVTDDLEQIEERIFLSLDTIGHVVHQEDVYFNVPSGQLKLRTNQTAKDCGELISTKPVPNHPSLMEVERTPVENTPQLRVTPRPHACRRSECYAKDNVEIHVDMLEESGNFVDIEIKNLNDFDWEAQLGKIKQELKIDDSQIVQSTYLELHQQAPPVGGQRRRRGERLQLISSLVSTNHTGLFISSRLIVYIHSTS
ncbi:CYTH domain-containing protein [Aphelenchoides fujianensis]|nr:CYTH domain-containing protein [Aphelenchoides fujianensis]